MGRSNHRARGSRHSVRRCVVSTVSTIAFLCQLGGSGVASAEVPPNVITGRASLPDGSAASGATGIVFGHASDVDAVDIVGAFRVADDGTFSVPIPANAPLVQMAASNGSVLDLLIAIALARPEPTVSGDEADVVFKAVQAATSILEPAAGSAGTPGAEAWAFRAPPHLTPVLARVDEAARQPFFASTPDQAGQGAEIERFADGDVAVAVATTIEYDLPVIQDAPSVQPTIRAAREVTAYATEAAEILHTTHRTLMPDAFDTEVMAGGGCVINGDELKKRRLKAYPPITMGEELSDEGIDVQYTTHSYQSDFARTLVGVGVTWQVETCNVGGADTRNGYRLRQIGFASTERVPQQTRIDQDWSVGKDVPTIEASVNMHVGSENDPVGISATMRQTATGKNGGSLGSHLPKRTPAYDGYRHNGAYARWEAVCDKLTVSKYCGSRDYQATVLQTLYEWPRTTVKQAVISFFIFGDRRCTAFGGCP
jgi:hypothetical protein